jgi:predicted XRE-type DNA-binding protein
MIKKEEWVTVNGYGGKFKVSNFGNVISFNISKKGRILKHTMSTSGYLTVSLMSKNVLLHRFIAEHFIKKDNVREIVNHKNGIKTDNRIENLEWCTYSENNKHAFDTGLKKKGKHLYNAKLSAELVLEIREVKRQGEYNQSDIARIYGVSNSLISAVINGKKWSYV